VAVMSVDHLHDMDMVDGAGQRIGAVKDLLIDASTGRMRYVVVAPGQGGIAGALGIGERLVAIPFSVVRLESGQMLLARDAAALASAPAYTRSHPPSFDDAYEQELARYWGAEALEGLEAADAAGLRAGSIASAQLPSVTALAGLGAVARTLAEKRVEAAQVVDDEGRVIGVVTLRDVALALGRAGQPGTSAAGAQPSRAALGEAAGAQAAAVASPAEQRQGDEAVVAPEPSTGMETAPPALAQVDMGERGAPVPNTQPRQQREDAQQGPEAVVCLKCGHANRPSATFCAACRTRLR
jgi:sporulation protein YlmC with PRC-barrel domain